MAGILYTVATPIGNLEDMTPRAIKTLESVDYILCEDTRVSSKLLARFQIKSKLVAYHKFNEKEQLERIVADLENGQNIALISDAGTPCVSDPGKVLVNELFSKGIKVTPISGACAVSTFLSASPKNNEEYIFTGFIPRTQKEQKEFFEKYDCADIIFYESPNRLLKTLENIKEILGENTVVTVGRELTKLYEEIKNGTICELISYFTQKEPKGEIVVMVHKNTNETLNANEKEIIEKIKILKEKDFSTKDISVILSSLYGFNKKTVYNLCNELD